MTAPATPSPLARLLQQWHATSPAHRTQLLTDAATATGGSVTAKPASAFAPPPGQPDERQRWIIHLHGITGSGPTSAAAMRDWAAGALQAVARETAAPTFRNHAEEIAHIRATTPHPQVQP